MHPETLSLATPVALMRQMAHDMRGPIGTLTATSDMLVKGVYGELNPQQLRASERIQRNSHRLLMLLDDLMAYVKAEAGQLTLAPDAFDPRGILADVKEQVVSTALAKGLTVELEIDASVPAQIMGDETLIRRIVLALLSNAIEFTEQGSVSVTSRWSDTAWQIVVRDSGPGIAPEDAPHIFEPFWRGPKRAQGTTAGFGLGLAMALALTKAMGGSLALTETGAGGSVFCLDLP